MIRSIIAAAFAAFIMFGFTGCNVVKMGWNFVTADLDPHASESYANMMANIKQYGDPARAMSKEYKVVDSPEDYSNDDIADVVKSLTEEHNLRVTGDITMFRPKKNAKGVLVDFDGEPIYDENGNVRHPHKIVYARIFSLCNLRTARIFLAYSRYYGSFMPCRIMLIQYANGERYLVTMDLALAIYGGKQLPEQMLNAALEVKKAMEEIPAKAATGDF